MLGRSAEDLATRAASRYDPSSAYGKARLTAGPMGKRKESPQQMEQRAALLAAQEKQRAGADSPAQRLALDALAARATEGYTYGRAADDLRTSNEATRERRNNGDSMLATGWTADNSADYARRTQAATMAGNKSLSGSMTPRGFAPEERPLDPRLSGQGRRQYGRMATDALQRQQQQTQQTMAATDAERRNIAERNRIATEGDAWLEQQQSQALRALATR